MREKYMRSQSTHRENNTIILKEAIKTSDHIKQVSRSKKYETSIKQENLREFNICYLKNKSTA